MKLKNFKLNLIKKKSIFPFNISFNGCLTPKQAEKLLHRLSKQKKLSQFTHEQWFIRSKTKVSWISICLLFQANGDFSRKTFKLFYLTELLLGITNLKPQMRLIWGERKRKLNNISKKVSSFVSSSIQILTIFRLVWFPPFFIHPSNRIFFIFCRCKIDTGKWENYIY